MRQPRFEVVRSDAEQPWHARFVAANGKTVWTTEQYDRRASVIKAINSILDPTYGWVDGDAVVCLQSRDSWNKRNRAVAMIRDVDERATP